MKPSLSVQQQVDLLVSRGLLISDAAAAETFLRSTNYYRFAGYARYFQQAPHQGDDRFRQGTSFEEIHAVYAADEQLRGFLAAPLAHAELLLRTHTARIIGDLHDPYGAYLDPQFYGDPRADDSPVEACLRDLRRSREHHILRYRSPGSGPSEFSQLPVWSAVEAWSFGTLSKVIERGADGRLGREIAASLGVPVAGFPYRIRALVYLRNRCAHLSRLWHHSVIDAGPTPNNVRAKAKRLAGGFGHRSILDVVSSLSDLLHRGAGASPILPELVHRHRPHTAFWSGLADPVSPRSHGERS